MIYKTVHGSHLYGLNHANSDLDTYSIYEGKGKTRQNISGKDDTTEISLDSFLTQASQGVPQALEAMFAPDDFVEQDKIRFLRKSFVPSGPEVIDRYRRTIYNHSERNTEKTRKHAIRLALNLRTLHRHGRFNPRLSFMERKCVTEMWQYPPHIFHEVLNEISEFEIYENP